MARGDHDKAIQSAYKCHTLMASLQGPGGGGVILTVIAHMIQTKLLSGFCKALS